MGQNTEIIHGITEVSNLAMGYKAQKWPYRAKEALEDTLSHLKNVERATATAQEAVINGDKLIAVKVMSDIRTQVMLAHSILIRAQAGEYETQ